MLAPSKAAEREDVRKAINLVTSVKMPFPENLSRNRAKTERVWLEREGATVGCIRLEDRRWCYEHIPPIGNRAEMLRIRTMNLRAGSISTPCSTTWSIMISTASRCRVDYPDRNDRAPHANCSHHRVLLAQYKRGEEFRDNFQKMYDEGIQIALKYFGE
jgi:hypothetical protein